MKDGVRVVLLAVVTACGGDQRSAAAPADTSRAAVSDTTPVVAHDSVSRSLPDSATTGELRETTATRRDTARTIATTPPRKPAPKPAPPVQTPPDTAMPAEPSAPALDTSSTTTTGDTTGPDTTGVAAQAPDTTSPAPEAATQASAPLRDQYHPAPLDTVSQQVYDGWKQYNLNCARCHGEDVLGTTIAPHLLVSLKPGGPINTKELFVQTVCAGRPAKGMPAWCPLGMEMPTIEGIYAYVKGRSDAKLRPGRPALREGG